jgi:hypothetical protein
MTGWEDLIPPLHDDAVAELEAARQAGLARTIELLGPVWRRWSGKASSLDLWPEVTRWPPAHIRESALALHAMACGAALGYSVQGSVLCGLSGLDVPWRASDLAWCLARVASMGSTDQEFLQLELPSVIASKLPTADLAPFAPALSALLEEVREDYFVATAVAAAPWRCLARRSTG